MFPSRSVLLTAWTGIVGACGGAKPATPLVELIPVGDTVLTSYAEVSDAVWLGQNRWAVLAATDQVAAIADFASRKAKPLAGPGSSNILNPASLFLGGDTLYLGDWGLRRLTLWSPQGNLIGSIPAAATVRGSLPRARDGAGWFYLDLYPLARRDGAGNRDSAAVLRVDRAFTRADTIARLAPLDIAEVVGSGGRRFERRVFSGVDRWGVLPDGSLWVARVYENRVDWRSRDGHWTRGELLPDRVLEVTRYDRELFIRRFPAELRSTARELPFAVLKPPFEAGLSGITGEVWLEKSRAPADSARRYQVVNRQGRLVREIRLRGEGRILAVGMGTALVAEPTLEGTRLLAVSLPTVTPPP